MAFAESPLAAWLAPRISAQPASPPSATLIKRLTVSPEKDACVSSDSFAQLTRSRAGGGAIAEAVFSG